MQDKSSIEITDLTPYLSEVIETRKYIKNLRLIRYPNGGKVGEVKFYNDVPILVKLAVMAALKNNFAAKCRQTGDEQFIEYAENIKFREWAGE